jgi:hypothetical protein
MRSPPRLRIAMRFLDMRSILYIPPKISVSREQAP